MGSAVRLSVLTFALAMALPASAETYWLRYEGDDFPENCGWTRIWNQPYADRWIEDGALVIDASADRHTCEWYEYYTDGMLWPVPPVEVGHPGSCFFIQWRAKTEEVSGAWMATTVGFFASEGWAVAFDMNSDTIRSEFESGLSALFDPGVFHDFELRSADMRTYELYIDGSLSIEGSFYHSAWSNKIVWGEGTTGSASLSRWDYFRTGIAPELGSGVALFVLMIAALTRRRTG
jgi:hypothetical protein